MSLLSIAFVILPWTPMFFMWFMIIRGIRRDRSKNTTLERQKMKQVKRDIKTVRKSVKTKYSSATPADIHSYLQSRSYFFDGTFEMGSGDRRERAYVWSAPMLIEGHYLVVSCHYNPRYGTMEIYTRISTVKPTMYDSNTFPVPKSEEIVHE